LVEESNDPLLTSPTPNNQVTPISGMQVEGVGDLLTILARCCKPMPGDDIIGFITRGRGITVHRRDCVNIRHEQEKERLIEINWGSNRPNVFPVTIRVAAWDRVGLLRDVSTVVAEEKVNMTSVLTTTHSDHTVTLLVTLEVNGVAQLSKMLSRIEGVKDVYEVRRDVPLVAPLKQSAAPAD
jgi:GTP pyrophosphokinase